MWDGDSLSPMKIAISLTSSKPTVWDGDLLVPSEKTAPPDAGGMESFFKFYLFFKTFCLAQDS